MGAKIFGNGFFLKCEFFLYYVVEMFFVSVVNFSKFTVLRVTGELSAHLLNLLKQFFAVKVKMTGILLFSILT